MANNIHLDPSLVRKVGPTIGVLISFIVNKSAKRTREEFSCTMDKLYDGTGLNRELFVWALRECAYEYGKPVEGRPICWKFEDGKINFTTKLSYLYSWADKYYLSGTRISGGAFKDAEIRSNMVAMIGEYQTKALDECSDILVVINSNKKKLLFDWLQFLHQKKSPLTTTSSMIAIVNRVKDSNYNETREKINWAIANNRTYI